MGLGPSHETKQRPVGVVPVTSISKDDEVEVVNFGASPPVSATPLADPNWGVPQVASSPLPHAAALPPGRPAVITFPGGGGAKEVLLAGEFNGWQPVIAMHHSEGDFTTILNLPPGKYQYKFLVDGKWRCAPDTPTTTDTAGNQNNLLEEQQRIFGHSRSGSTGGEPPGEYTQQVPLDDYFKEPPAAPPHLQRALLNAGDPRSDPSLLPMPHHVIVNHLYSTKHQEDALVLGATHRYRDKFVTTVYYRPIATIRN